VQAGLPEGWGSARLELTVDAGDFDRAAALLGPAQPYLTAPGTLRFGVAQDGSGPGCDSIRRLLERLDEAGIGGTLTASSSEEAAVTPEVAELTLAESWDAALATLPSDWSDVVGEVDLISSD
jgi:hypothetical protein